MQASLDREKKENSKEEKSENAKTFSAFSSSDLNFSHNCYAVILAAGQGRRLSTKTQNSQPKQFYLFEEKPLYWHSINAFAQCPFISGIVIVFNEENYERAEKEINAFKKEFSLPIILTKGGLKRQDSVYNGLQSLPKNCDIVFIHDAARPFVKNSLISSLIKYISKSEFSAVIPSLAVSDTIKEVKGYDFENKEKNQKNSKLYTVLSTPQRDNLRAVQTPQVFCTKTLLKAHKNLIDKHITVTDDAMAIELIDGSILCIEGDSDNKKITYIEDLALINDNKNLKSINNAFSYITTQGYDVHAYTTNDDIKARPFKLATVVIPTKICIKAHSDGDVLLHALMDALLALVCAGDIGQHFPDKDKTYENISSAILLDKVLKILSESQYDIELSHIDITLIAQEPKISPYIIQIRKALAHLLLLPLEKVSIKSSTEEKLGFTGELKGIKASVIVSAIKSDKKKSL